MYQFNPKKVCPQPAQAQLFSNRDQEFALRSDVAPKVPSIDSILLEYQNKFSAKVYSEENDDHDILMDVFGISPLIKRENRQYWGRELGMCWQRLVVDLCKRSRPDFAPPLRIAGDEPCDMIVGNMAIDTKYRIGSGDSGTLKKFKAYGSLLKSKGYEPVLLILRDDNRLGSVGACAAGGWRVITGQQSLDFLKELTGLSLEDCLLQKANSFPISRA